MTLDETIKRLGKFGAYVEGDWFRPNALAEFRSCDLQEAQAMCRDAFKAGNLKKKTRKVNGKARIYYRKAVLCPAAYGPWRKLTNAEIGIVEPFQFGVAI